MANFSDKFFCGSLISRKLSPAEMSNNKIVDDFLWLTIVVSVRRQGATKGLSDSPGLVE